MSEKKAYDEVGVIRILAKNRGVRVVGRKITVSSTSTSVGNGTWGKIDYLEKKHGYSVEVSDKLPMQHFNNGHSKTKKEKKELPKKPKFNMASMSKTAMAKHKR